MKKIVCLILVVVMTMIMFFSISGCVSQDANGKWTVSLSPDAADKIEQGADLGTSVLSLMSIFVPGLAGVAGAAAAGTATYKKMKPSLVKNRAVSEHVVKSLQTVKETQPELWKELKTHMEKDCNADVDVAIDEIVNVIKQMEKTKVK